VSAPRSSFIANTARKEERSGWKKGKIEATDKGWRKKGINEVEEGKGLKSHGKTTPPTPPPPNISHRKERKRSDKKSNTESGP